MKTNKSWSLHEGSTTKPIILVKRFNGKYIMEKGFAHSDHWPRRKHTNVPKIIILWVLREIQGNLREETDNYKDIRRGQMSFSQQWTYIRDRHWSHLSYGWADQSHSRWYPRCMLFANGIILVDYTSGVDEKMKIWRTLASGL